MPKPIKATVAILTFNGAEYLEELLVSLQKQQTAFDYEILVIDSGSKDNTLEIISRFPNVKLHEIPNSEFGHGKTRNLAAQLAKGEIVAYLTQDAVPTQETWLKSMMEPFSLDEKVFCVFGKQIPRPDCAAPIKREVWSVFAGLGPDHSLMVHRGKFLDGSGPLPAQLGFMSDVNSAVRRDYLLHKIPFRDVNYAEDQALGADVLAAGYLKVYAPEAAVLHSHNYPAKKYFHRKYDELIGLRKTTGHITRMRLRGMAYYIVKSSVMDWLFIFRDKDYSLAAKTVHLTKSPLYNINFCRAVRLASRTNISADEQAKLSLEAQQRGRS